MKRVHAGTVQGGLAAPGNLVGKPTADMHRLAVSSVFHLSRSLKSMPWQRVEQFAEELRPMLVQADARWGAD